MGAQLIMAGLMCKRRRLTEQNQDSEKPGWNAVVMQLHSVVSIKHELSASRKICRLIPKRSHRVHGNAFAVTDEAHFFRWWSP